MAEDEKRIVIRENSTSVDSEEEEGSFLMPATEICSVKDVQINSSSDIHIGNKMYYNGPVVIKQYFNQPPNKYQQSGNISTEFVDPVDLFKEVDVLPTDISHRIKSRGEWFALPPRHEIPRLEVSPAPYVIIIHTAGSKFTNPTACRNAVRNIQAGHIAMGWADISYNFLVGGDGFIYVGRGWDKEGCHTEALNSKSIGVAFIGNFMVELPPPKQIEAAKLLLEQGIRLGKLDKNYKLIAHKQVKSTESPGVALIEEIMKWPHWATYE